MIYPLLNDESRKKLHQHSILKSVFNENQVSIAEKVYILAVLSLSLYSLGFIFTMSIMLFPGVLLAEKMMSYRSFTVLSGLAVFFSSLFGLVVSIAYENISTVPIQVILLFTLLVFMRFMRFCDW